MLIHPEEILETIKMVTNENLDIRTVTMGINLRGCSHPDIRIFNEQVFSRILRCAENLVRTTEEIQTLYGIPIINKRISVTPIAIVAESCQADDYVSVAETLDRVARDAGIDFSGGNHGFASAANPPTPC